MGAEQGVAAAYSRRIQTAQPRITSLPGKSYRVVHRELVSASIAGSTTFTVQSALSINPGLSVTFPWLAPQAIQWEQYICHRLDVIWVPFAPTSTQGDVIISPEYDASELTPTTETQVSDSQDTVIDSCWKSIVCCLDPAAMQGLGPRRFVRGNALAGDIKTYDVAKVYVATNNETGTTAIGKLYIEYDFEFFKPQNSPSGLSSSTQVSQYTITSNATLTSGVATPALFAVITYDPLNFGAAVAGVFTPPAGVYKIEGCIGFSQTDDGAGSCAVDWLVQIFKNGALVTNEQSQSSTISSIINVLVYSIEVPFNGIISMNGTDTFQIQVTATNNGGTGTATARTLVGTRAQLLISLA
jgi:hypothetical protein